MIEVLSDQNILKKNRDMKLSLKPACRGSFFVHFGLVWSLLGSNWTLNIKISDKNLNYLMNNSRRDIKTIFRTLSQLEKESLERKKSIGLNLIKEVIRNS